MDLSAALAIATPVADALAYAHRMGVLHRDIKPENILFSQGHPIVADFGIARAVSAATGPHLTRTGLALGTPGYMSPEQAVAAGDFDERTDVYGFAAVIYEMLVGEVPRVWPTEDEVRTGRFTEAPAAHRSRLARAAPPPRARWHAVSRCVRRNGPAPGRAAGRADREGEATSRVRRGRGERHRAEGSRPRGLRAHRARGAMTIGGVEALAAEVGIKPELVRSAASSMSRADQRRRRSSRSSHPRTIDSSAGRPGSCSNGWLTASSMTWSSPSSWTRSVG